MLTIHPYGILIAWGMVVAYFVAKKRRKAYGLSADDLDRLSLLIIPLGIIGARLYHVLDKFSYYQNSPWEIFAVWQGGLGIYGAIIGGVVGIFIFQNQKLKSKKQNDNIIIKNIEPMANSQWPIATLDFVMPSLAIGQAIGRIGNYFNYEVFGPPAGGFPWGWYIPKNLRPEYWKNYSYFHPTFAYESLWALIGFAALILLERKIKSEAGEFFPASKSFKKPGTDSSKIAQTSLQLSPGLLTGFYCVWYGTGRFFLEFLRFDTAEINQVKVAQMISLGLMSVGIWLIYRAKSLR